MKHEDLQLGLAVSPGCADQVGVHVLIHDQKVAWPKVGSHKPGAVGDGVRAEVTVQIVLHFWDMI